MAADFVWIEGTPDPARDPYERVRVGDATLLECPVCDALVANRADSAERHTAWHRRAG